jgi:hypothetical protein
MKTLAARDVKNRRADIAASGFYFCWNGGF